MTNTENTYRSILLKISMLPADYLEQLNDYLQQLSQQAEAEKQTNKTKILSLAGSWSDMDDATFNQYLKAAKDAGNNMFSGKNIDL